VQFAFAMTLLQLFVWVKLLLTIPLIVIGETLMAPVPVLLRVTATRVELVPVMVGGKLMNELESGELGVLAMPVTESGMKKDDVP